MILFRLIIIGLTGGTFLSHEASANSSLSQAERPNFQKVDPNLDKVSIKSIWHSIYTATNVSKKDNFESNADISERIRNNLGELTRNGLDVTGFQIITAACNCDGQAQDAGLYFSQDTREFRRLIETESEIVLHHESADDTYIGENAFGKKIAVNRHTGNYYAIYTGRDRPDIYDRKKKVTLANIAIKAQSANEAREMAKDIRIGYVIKLRNPFTTAHAEGSDPTLNRPAMTRYIYHELYADIFDVFVYSASNRNIIKWVKVAK